jgi:hypothetical protein
MAKEQYVYIPDGNDEYGPVWDVEEAIEHFTPDELAKARQAELVVSLEDRRGHYLTADWLMEVAGLLGEVSGDDPFTHADRTTRLDTLKEEVIEAAEVYRRHNELTNVDVEHHSPNCTCDFIYEIADEVEELITEAGYITEWGDGGVQTFYLKGEN